MADPEFSGEFRPKPPAFNDSLYPAFIEDPNLNEKLGLAEPLQGLRNDEVDDL